MQLKPIRRTRLSEFPISGCGFLQYNEFGVKGLGRGGGGTGAGASLLPVNRSSNDQIDVRISRFIEVFWNPSFRDPYTSSSRDLLGPYMTRHVTVQAIGKTWSTILPDYHHLQLRRPHHHPRLLSLLQSVQPLDHQNHYLMS